MATATAQGFEFKGLVLDYSDAETVKVQRVSANAVQVTLDDALTVIFTTADIGVKVTQTEWDVLVAAAVAPVERILVDVINAEAVELDLKTAQIDHDAAPGEEVISVLTLCGVNVDIERADIGALVTQTEWDHLYQIAERV